MTEQRKSQYHKAWRIVYTLYPPILRVLEKLKFHKGRQPYVVGFLNKAKYSPADLKQYLFSLGFEPALLAWVDTDQSFGLRKVDNHIFQYHIRLHDDGEIRGHYEYSSEGNPIGHVTEKVFEPRKDFFVSILNDYLQN